jgi:hypothetical protein
MMKPGLAQWIALIAALGASACGGGGDNDTASGSRPQTPAPAPITPPPGAPAPAPAPAPTPQGDFSIAGVEFAQALVFPSQDSGMVLVANRAVLAKVNLVASNAASAKPSGVLRVESAAGTLLQELPLDPPSGDLPQTAPTRPSFADSYTVTLPAALVRPGIRVSARMTPPATNESTLTPHVGGGATLRLVAVPIQIGGTVGQIVDRPEAYLAARLPVATVTREDHAPYVSRSVTQLPTTSAQWSSAFPKLLNELDDLHLLENASARTYYYGFVPKRTFGLAGIGFRPGNAALGFDLPTQAAVVKETMVHEVGHNLSLAHAPCGNPAGTDPQFPYANAQLGAGSRFIWGYDAEARRFIDPRPTTVHDVMSYCDGDWFSDYNYRRMQAHLTPGDSTLASTDPTAALDVAQELLMVSGRIDSGVLELQPLRPLHGTPRPPDATGSYLMRITTQAGGVVEVRFAAREIDHLPQQRFGFSIPHPGPIARIEVLTNGRVLHTREARKRALATAAEGTATPLLQSGESAGQLQVTWDASRYPLLSVTHVGAKRSVLAMDLQGGSATLPVGALPAGGRFEFGLSDGLNSERVLRDR